MKAVPLVNIARPAARESFIMPVEGSSSLHICNTINMEYRIKKLTTISFCVLHACKIAIGMVAVINATRSCVFLPELNMVVIRVATVIFPIKNIH